VSADFQKCSDEELAQQSQDGTLSAFEELVYRYEGRIYGFIANSCRNATDAREVTQDTFVRAFQAIGQFDGRRGFAPWLFTIARRKCIDHHRAAQVPHVFHASFAAPHLDDDLLGLGRARVVAEEDFAVDAVVGPFLLLHGSRADEAQRPPLESIFDLLGQVTAKEAENASG
jgi:RNA polymerase sigma factor (sigma-70 family)